MKRVYLISMVLGLSLSLLSLTPDSVDAAHFTYGAQKANAMGLQSNTIAMRPWAINGQTAIWCNGLGAHQASWDAVAEYNNAAPWPFQELTHQCGVTPSMDIVDNTGPWGPMPSGCGTPASTIGCAQLITSFDSHRAGYYVTFARVWVNRVNFQFSGPNAYNGLRSVITHELGHVFGLDEQYVEGGFGCNPNSYSIMDRSRTDNAYSPPRVEGGCDVNTIDSGTLSNYQEFYVMTSAAFQPNNVTSTKVTTNSMILYWDDRSPTESAYPVHVFNWLNGAWHPFGAVLMKSSQIATGDPWQSAPVNQTITRNPGDPVTYYIGCLYTRSGVIGDRYWMCSNNYQWLGS